jgi:hypothetical protein
MKMGAIVLPFSHDAATRHALRPAASCSGVTCASNWLATAAGDLSSGANPSRRMDQSMQSGPQARSPGPQQTRQPEKWNSQKASAVEIPGTQCTYGQLRHKAKSRQDIFRDYRLAVAAVPRD